jgi:hypothetical protein
MIQETLAPLWRYFKTFGHQTGAAASWVQRRLELTAATAMPDDDAMRYAAAKAEAEAPVIWLLGKTQAGKTSIVAALTGEGRNDIGDGFQPATRTARKYAWPPERPLLRFLDTRGLADAGTASSRWSRCCPSSPMREMPLRFSAAASAALFSGAHVAAAFTGAVSSSPINSSDRFSRRTLRMGTLFRMRRIVQARRSGTVGCYFGARYAAAFAMLVAIVAWGVITVRSLPCAAPPVPLGSRRSQLPKVWTAYRTHLPRR